MHPRVRATITILFTLLFVATVPIVILYTSGYGFNWKRQRVQKTGLIQVETTPAAAEVLLDGVPQKKTTPSSYARLLPEDYAVQILKRGYIPWQKTLKVTSGETTFATGITLYKDTLPRLSLDARTDIAAWSPDGQTIAYVSDDGKWQEVATLANGQSRTLLARFPHATYSDARLAWSPGSDAILLTATTSSTTSTSSGSSTGDVTHVLKFAADGITPTLAVHERFPKGTLRARWSLDGSSIIVMNSAGATSMNPTTGIASPMRLTPDLLDAELRGRNVFTLRTVRDVNAPQVVIERGIGKDVTTVAQLPLGDYRFVQGTERFLAVADTKRNKMMLIDLNDGSVDAYDATDIGWSAKGNRALVWNDFEISVVNLDDGTRTLVTRLGTTISHCEWSPSGDAVIYATPNGISVAEFDDRDRRVVLDLVRFSEIGAFTIDTKAKMLRFVGSIGNQHGIYERDL